MNRITAIAAISFICLGGSALAKEAEKTMVLPSERGNVTFEHKKHIDLKNTCAPCHKSEEGGKIEGFGKEMAHDVCKGCHVQAKAGPTKCAECHIK